MTKNCIFGAPNLRQSKQITQPLVVMVETFKMSAAPYGLHFTTVLCSTLKFNTVHYNVLAGNTIIFRTMYLYYQPVLSSSEKCSVLHGNTK